MEGAAYLEWVISPPLVQSTDSLTDMPRGLAAKLRVNMNDIHGLCHFRAEGKRKLPVPPNPLPLVIMPLAINIFLSGLSPSVCNQDSITKMEGLARHLSDILSWLGFLLL